jgi:hypothetical protein
MRILRSVALSVGILGLSVACGGSSKDEPTTPEPAATEPAAEPAAEPAPEGTEGTDPATGTDPCGGTANPCGGTETPEGGTTP